MNASACKQADDDDIHITNTSHEAALQMQKEEICDLKPGYETKHENSVIVANVDVNFHSKRDPSRESESSEAIEHDLNLQHEISDVDANNRGINENDAVSPERLQVLDQDKAIVELDNNESKVVDTPICELDNNESKVVEKAICELDNNESKVVDTAIVELDNNASKVVDISDDKDYRFCKTDTLEVVQFVDLDECVGDASTLSLDEINDLKLDEDFEKFMQENSDEDVSDINANTFNGSIGTWNISSSATAGRSNVTEIGQAVAENCFGRLPAELIIQIFSYLTTEDLCRCVAPVCRAWREMSLDHSLWQSIDLGHHPNISSLEFLWVIRRAPLLRKLSCSGRVSLSLAEVDIFTKFCPALQEVDFGFCDSLNAHMIETLVQNCPSLCRINVEGCEKLRQECVERFARCKQLTRINLSHCFLDEKSVVYLAEHLPRIISINLDGISGFTFRGLESLVLHHGSTLAELVLDGAEIGDDAFHLLAQCGSLKHLAMSFCECLTDQALIHITDLPRLESLKLRKGMDLSADALTRYFQKAPLTNLHTLNLSECSNVSDDVVLEMAKVCGKYLKQLELSWCWFITDKGLVSIVDHCCNLELLDLLGIDKITGECLQRVPEEMPKLGFLDLRQCNQILDDLIYDVVRRKPDLKVLNYYGEEFVHS